MKAIGIRVLAGTILLAIGASAQSLADETTVGVSAMVTSGTHAESTATATIPAIPAPLINISHRRKNLEVYVEGFPPLGPIGVGNNGLGLHSVQLTYLDGVVRWYTPDGKTAFGLGETVYNQQSEYLHGAMPQFSVASSIEDDRSRIVGGQYQLWHEIVGGPRAQLWFLASINPAMRANLMQSTIYTWNSGGQSARVTSTPESGSQVDVSVGRDVRERRSVVSFGVRYVNLTMRFPNGSLADRNTVLMPFAGMRFLMR